MSSTATHNSQLTHIRLPRSSCRAPDKIAGSAGWDVQVSSGLYPNKLTVRNNMAIESRTTSYGFIGLGAMGYWMASNLRTKTDGSLIVYDVAATVLEDFKSTHSAKGSVEIATSAAEVVAASDVIFSIVPEGKHVLAVFSDSAGGALSLAPAALSGKTFIECSTIDVATSSVVADAISSRGATFVDAPVSGGTAGARAGTLTFMVGMKDDEGGDFDRVRTILRMMGRNVFACGGPTLGLAAKLCNNYISGTIAIATSEGMNLAMRLGLDPRVFSDVLKVSTGASYINSHVNPVPRVDPAAPSSSDYAPGFKVQLMRKDYNLALEAAERVGAEMHLGPKGLEVFTGASNDARCADRDCRVVFRYIGGNEQWS